MQQTGKLKVSIKNNQNAVKIPSGIRLLIRRCCHAVLIRETPPSTCSSARERS